jgi:hypothetical protein
MSVQLFASAVCLSAGIRRNQFESEGGELGGVEKLANMILKEKNCGNACEDAAGLLRALFGGLNFAGAIENSELDGNTVKVTTTGKGAVGELATKSRVPYDVIVYKHVNATFSHEKGRAVLKMEGLYFAPVDGMESYFITAKEYTNIAAEDGCKKECPMIGDDWRNTMPIQDVVACESCVAYEWYKANKGEVDGNTNKMARILTNTPFSNPALGWEQEQGAWVPSLVGDKNRRRIIYSMLTAAPTRIKDFIFGASPVDFNAPKKTYKDKRYVSAETEPDFRGDELLAAFFKSNKLLEKSQEVGKQALIGRKGTTYDYPLDMAENKLRMGTSGINFARMVAAGSAELRAAKPNGIFVRPAKPDKVMKMLGVCKEATKIVDGMRDETLIDSGCSGDEGRVRWGPAA